MSSDTTVAAGVTIGIALLGWLIVDLRDLRSDLREDIRRLDSKVTQIQSELTELNRSVGCLEGSLPGKPKAQGLKVEDLKH